MTDNYYGSCSGCDALESLLVKNSSISEYVKLCKDIVCNIVKPYNYGWRREEEFEPMKMLLKALRRSIPFLSKPPYT